MFSSFAFSGNRALELSENFNPVRNDFFNKPFGGIWLSKFLKEKKTTVWSEWCSARLELEKDNSFISKVEFSENSKILSLKNISDAENCYKRYPLRASDLVSQEEIDFLGEEFYSHRILDFERISKYYDAVHVTEKLIIDSRKKSILDLTFTYWDIESICVFNPEIISITETFKV